MTLFIERFNALCDAKCFHEMIETVPYAKLIGVSCQEDENGDLLFLLPFHAHNIGNTILPALHCIALHCIALHCIAWRGDWRVFGKCGVALFDLAPYIGEYSENSGFFA